jgi:SagB-type dehydrogenase family enzyme
MSQRRSVRRYANRQISLSQSSQLLWAAQGITDVSRGLRTAPSAGALHPLEIYLVAARIDSLQAGLYRYRPLTHDLILVQPGDILSRLSEGLQGWAVEASAIIVISAVYNRTSVKYGDRAARYVHIEVGHVAQNILLQATALELASGVIGAFDDQEMRSLLGLPEKEDVLYVIPVGYRP